MREDSRKCTSDDFKLEPIDDVIEDSPDVKMEVFEIENSEEAIKHDHNPTEMPPEIIIEAIGTDDVKIEVLEINTVDDESFENKTRNEESVKTEQCSFEEFKVKMSADFDDNTDFFIADQINSEFSKSVENSGPQIIELNEQTENNLT